MPRARRASPDVARVRDRSGRTWTITVMSIDEDDLAPWLDLSHAERIELIGECVKDGLRLEGKLDVPRLRRVCRVTERVASGRPQDLADVDVLKRSAKRLGSRRPR